MRAMGVLEGKTWPVKIEVIFSCTQSLTGGKCLKCFPEMMTHCKSVRLEDEMLIYPLQLWSLSVTHHTTMVMICNAQVNCVCHG